MFVVQHKVFGFKTKKTPIFGQEGVATKLFFINLGFAKCGKLSSFFGPFFWQILVDVSKSYEIGVSAHFKAKKENDHFWWLLSGPSKGYYLVQVKLGVQNKANLDQITTINFFARKFVKGLKPLFL